MHLGRRSFYCSSRSLLVPRARVHHNMVRAPGPVEEYQAALLHAAAMHHRFLAWQRGRDEEDALLAGARPGFEGTFPTCDPQLLLGAPPGLDDALPSYPPHLLSLPTTTEKGVQTDIVASDLFDYKTEVDAQVITEDEVLGAIRELKLPLVDAVADLSPALRAQHCHIHEPMVLAKLAFDLLMSQKLGVSRTSLLDIIVLCVAEARGCSCRGVFDDGLQEVFGESWDSTWHSRLHNSVFQVLRVNDIPCFGKRRRRGPKKGAVVASATAYGDEPSAIQSRELASDEPVLGGAIPSTLLWLGPEC